jgi:hypothetical protein
MNKKTTPFMMLIIALIILTIIFIYLITNAPNDKTFWFIRVLTSLAAGAISMSLAGTINIGTKENMTTLAEQTPKITASGALAVFVIVYLFNPVSF